jgi:hypothetical protein
MTSQYAAYDWEVVDYNIYALDPNIPDAETNQPLNLRGPQPSLANGKYFTCIGAAQTFGRFCQRPFPLLLAERLGTPALNLGRGGAGPSFFLQSNELLDYINGSCFAIVQIMSGRSESNSLYESKGLGFYRRRSDRSEIVSDDAFQELLLKGDASIVRKIVRETRQNWVDNNLRLLRVIRVPTILLWFSTRSPQYVENYNSVTGLFGDFPQLVNDEMVDQIKSYATDYVECVSSRGLPQPLFSRFTGESITIKDPWGEWSSNSYYPSPVIHLEAADALESTCRDLCARAGVR